MRCRGDDIDDAGTVAVRHVRMRGDGARDHADDVDLEEASGFRQSQFADGFAVFVAVQSGVVEMRTTVAPSSASATPKAFPKPRAPPVMTAVVSARVRSTVSNGRFLSVTSDSFVAAAGSENSILSIRNVVFAHPPTTSFGGSDVVISLAPSRDEIGTDSPVGPKLHFSSIPLAASRRLPRPRSRPPPPTTPAADCYVRNGFRLGQEPHFRWPEHGPPKPRNARLEPDPAGESAARIVPCRPRTRRKRRSFVAKRTSLAGRAGPSLESTR